MSGRTPRFSFTTLDEDREKFDFDTYRFGLYNRQAMDRLLAYAAEQHVHSGEPIDHELPSAPSVEVREPGTGLIGPGDQAYYRYARVEVNGLEGPASAVAVARTPNQIPAPAQPSASPVTGVLPAGVYSYAITWWTGVDRCETPASEIVTLTSGTAPWQAGNLISIPRVHPSATGWSIYRKGPMDSEWSRIAQLDDRHFVGIPTEFVDDGNPDANGYLLSPSIQMPLPTTNATFDRCSVDINISEYEDEDPLPQIKIYRTFDPLNWQDSLIAWSTSALFNDTGVPGTKGVPQDSSEALSGVDQIELASVETEGVLPSGLVTAPFQISLVAEGYVDVGYSRFMWISEFERAAIRSIRARVMSGPVEVQDIIVSLERRSEFGVWAEMEQCRTFIPIGETVGAVTVPEIFDPTNEELREGDAVRLLVIQAGAGPSLNLVVSVGMFVRYGSIDETYVWSV